MAKRRASTISRRIPSDLKSPLRSYATVIGEVVWASNFAHGAFEILFSHVATQDNYQIGRALWHTMPSDSGQLVALREATKASNHLPEKMKIKIIWAIEKAQKLGELRNDAVHSATIVIERNGLPTVVPSDIGTKPSRSEKLRREKDLKKKFRAVKGDLLQIGQYVHSLWPHIAGFDLLPPLPRKPQLKSLPKQTHRKSNDRRAKK